MTDFQLPTSSQVSRERTPPEVEELSTLLSEAVRVVPEIAPLLVLGSVTGMRRGELVGLRRHRIDIRRLEIIVDTASDQGGRVKATKTRRRRTVQIDGATAAMLERHMASMDDRAEVCGVVVARDAFVFSEAPDCSVAWVPDTVTKRVAVLKEHLGIADKRPETIAREDAALALFKGERPKRRAGRPGGTAKGGLSYAEIARRFDRTEMWALHAIRSAERREAADARGLNLNFDGSILALRKFTSTELLDAGFNLSMVAERQGHGTQVLVKHYSRSRRSADRKAAEHLGRVVHGENSPGSL
jgi:integrase